MSSSQGRYTLRLPLNLPMNRALAQYLDAIPKGSARQQYIRNALINQMIADIKCMAQVGGADPGSLGLSPEMFAQLAHVAGSAPGVAPASAPVQGRPAAPGSAAGLQPVTPTASPSAQDDQPAPEEAHSDERSRDGGKAKFSDLGAVFNI